MANHGDDIADAVRILATAHERARDKRESPSTPQVQAPLPV
jgi:hypothetical protein